MRPATLLAAALALAALAALAAPADAAARIEVRSPQRLALLYPPATDGIPNKPALFGFPSFQGSIGGVLVYGTYEDKDGCLPLNKSRIEEERERLAEGGEIIVMLDRGGVNCSFRHKVLLAEDAGARAVIIVNNKTGPPPFMRDDGGARQPEIPSFIIAKDDGDNLKQFVNDETKPVELELIWGLPHPDDRVEWKLWTSSVDDGAADFKRDFRSVAAALGDKAELEVAYRTFRGYSFTSPDLCINGHNYCSFPPPGVDWPGRLVVKENLRQACVWQYANETRQPDLWWAYANEWRESCQPQLTEENHDACSEAVDAKVGIATEKIAKCVTESNLANGTNTILEKFIDEGHEERVFFQPYVLINEEPFRGSLQCVNPATFAHCGLLQALCAGFSEEGLPLACQPNDGCPLLQFPDKCGVCNGDNSTCTEAGPTTEGGGKGGGGGTSVGTVIAIVVCVVIVVVVGVVFYVRRQRQQMRVDLDNILSSYMPMDSEGNPQPRRGGTSARINSPEEEVLM